MPPNLAQTLYFRLQDQHRQNQLMQREGENANAKIMLEAGDQAERARQGAFDRELQQSESLGRRAALDGTETPQFTNENFNIGAGGAASDVKGQLRATQQKGQLLRDIQALKDREAGRRIDAAQNAQTDRAGIQAESAEEVARINQSGLNYRAKNYPHMPSAAKPPLPYDPKVNPGAARALNIRTKMNAYAKVWNEGEMANAAKELHQAEQEAEAFARMMGHPGVDETPAALPAPSLEPLPHDDQPSDDEFDQYLK